jgi:hypothetical protein
MTFPWKKHKISCETVSSILHSDCLSRIEVKQLQSKGDRQSDVTGQVRNARRVFPPRGERASEATSRSSTAKVITNTQSCSTTLSQDITIKLTSATRYHVPGCLCSYQGKPLHPPSAADLRHLFDDGSLALAQSALARATTTRVLSSQIYSPTARIALQST